MLRRTFTTLLALSPLVLTLKPSSHRGPLEVRCESCGCLLGTWVVRWPGRLDKVGRAWCAEHAVAQPGHESGKGLITGYHFGVQDDGWDEYKKLCSYPLPADSQPCFEFHDAIEVKRVYG